MSTPYDADFYAAQSDSSLVSARAVAPFVLEILHPRSIVDFGSGVGTWLRAFMDLGIKDVLGLDGTYVETDALRIPVEHFLPSDLSQPIDLGRKFDLVMSLEVAEHLPPECAQSFVRSLTLHGDVVLFSAAVPAQGGTNHVNEQWASYWKALFDDCGFACVDCLRQRFWEDERVCWWYRQNMLLFVKRGVLMNYPDLPETTGMPIDVVHPGSVGGTGAPETIFTKIGRRMHAITRRFDA